MKKDAKFFLVLALVLLASAARFIDAEPNFSPLTAIALISGMYLGKRFYTFLIPLLILIVSDLALFAFKFTTFEPAFYFKTTAIVYFSMSLIVGMGILTKLLTKNSGKAVFFSSGVFASVLAAFLFFGVSNFGFWLIGGLYPLTLEGLGVCFAEAWPFFRATLVSSVLFSAAIMGVIAMLEKLVAVTKINDRSLHVKER